MKADNQNTWKRQDYFQFSISIALYSRMRKGLNDPRERERERAREQERKRDRVCMSERNGLIRGHDSFDRLKYKCSGK